MLPKWRTEELIYFVYLCVYKINVSFLWIYKSFVDLLTPCYPRNAMRKTCRRSRSTRSDLHLVSVKHSYRIWITLTPYILVRLQPYCFGRENITCRALTASNYVAESAKSWVTELRGEGKFHTDQITFWDISSLHTLHSVTQHVADSAQIPTQKDPAINLGLEPWIHHHMRFACPGEISSMWSIVYTQHILFLRCLCFLFVSQSFNKVQIQRLKQTEMQNISKSLFC